jgi:hypothetical protein
VRAFETVQRSREILDSLDDDISKADAPQFASREAGISAGRKSVEAGR